MEVSLEITFWKQFANKRASNKSLVLLTIHKVKDLSSDLIDPFKNHLLIIDSNSQVRLLWEQRTRSAQDTKLKSAAELC